MPTWAGRRELFFFDTDNSVSQRARRVLDERAERPDLSCESGDLVNCAQEVQECGCPIELTAENLSYSCEKLSLCKGRRG